jgi:hypothetical protein
MLGRSGSAQKSVALLLTDSIQVGVITHKNPICGALKTE